MGRDKLSLSELNKDSFVPFAVKQRCRVLQQAIENDYNNKSKSVSSAKSWKPSGIGGTGSSKQFWGIGGGEGTLKMED